ncbi:MAG: bifunctional demethylmenaquinone methyltransferase/2-methoxy-6-polyprenyl-1,4-benzoquinol methylase UbiE [Phycisphaerales bacterium]|nr:MAG: bifunctional demethylmenaquinone methyltransferase/2-methoxy-6-polyprenyl-1,4-benzoquinol methylase UbiE [Phycisphaerales bacterium]
MFAAIARSYDLNNRVHSLWQDQRWRASAVRAGGVRPGDRVLDVACGTGDLTQAFARTPASEVVGLDFTRPMLDIAEHKKARLPERAGSKIAYLEGDAMALPFEDASFDVVSIAFGIRNVQEPRRALAEFARVLKPGGRLVILEFDTPRLAPVRWFNSFYAGWVMPRTATLISRDRSGAYRYLPRSVGAFMTRDELVGAIGAAGFEGASAKGLSLGICVRYLARRR